MKRFIVFASAMLFSLFFFYGCGGDSGDIVASASESSDYSKLGAYKDTVTRYPEEGLHDGYVVYYPDGNITSDTPVVLFLEGGGNDLHVDAYKGIMQYLASYGYFVIGGETGEGYNIAYYTHIFDSAIDTAKEYHNLTVNKLAVVGHSQGGGDVFYVMKHFQNQGYGSEASLSLSVDGWFAFDMNQADLRELKGRVSFLQMNGVEGTGTDPRIDLTIWNLASQTDRKFLTLKEGTEHMYIAGDLNAILGKKDLISTIGSLVDDAFNGTNNAYNALPDEKKSSYDEISDNLKDPSQYHGGDCAGEQFNAKNELKDYDIDYCHPENYR